MGTGAPHVVASVCRQLLAGTLVIVVELAINGFDLVNDAIGALIIAVAVSRLRGAVVGAGNDGRVRWLQVLAVLGVVLAITDQLGGWEHATWVQLVGVLLLGVVFERHAAEVGWDGTAARWSLDRRLVLWLAVVPLAIIEVLGIVVDDPSGVAEALVPAAIVVVVLGLVALVHLIQTLWHTAGVADRAEEPLGPVSGEQGGRDVDEA